MASALESDGTRSRGTWSTGMRIAVATTVAALAVTGGTVTAAYAAPGEFLTSFEQADAQPLASEQFDAVNVVGSTPEPGSLQERIADVTATDENPPGEGAGNLIDGNASTKWLAFATTASITYTLDAPVAVVRYTMTSGGDAEQRDPRDFVIEGSTDGETWTAVDTQTGQSFEDRGTTNEYTVTEPVAYGQYRMTISANQSGGIIQLADWEIFEAPADGPPIAAPMITAVGNGPLGGPTNKAGAGFSGTKALRYAGEHVGEGAASATNVLYDDLDIEVGSDTRFSYKIFPEFGDDPDDLEYPATYAAVDLVLADGSRVSADPAIVDTYGGRLTAADQGATKILYADQWNSVRVELGDLEGETITGILFTYDNAGGTAETAFQGWVDDIRIDPAPERIDENGSRIEYVDTRRGTHSTGSFSRGNNIPAAAVPNGFNFWVPMTNASSRSWIYDYARGNNDANLPELQGLGVSHEPSPWMGDRNQLAFLPGLDTGSAPDATLETRALEFDHANEIARPDLYSVQTTNGIAAEVTPTDHGAIMRFDYPGETGNVIVDRVGSDDTDDPDGAAGLAIAADGSLTGWVEGGSGLSVGATRMFVAGQFDRAPSVTGEAANREAARYATFDTAGDEPLELRLATSFISQDQAQRNLDLEVTGRSFDEVRSAAEEMWNERLSVIDLEGANEDQLVTTYSSLYRLNLYPNSQFENTGTSANPVYEYASPVAPTEGDATATETNAQIKPGKIYVNNGFWDTYRTIWPAYSLLYPEMAEELIDGFVQQYRDGGWVARWSSPGYADLMTGTSSDVAFADAYVKGVGIENALDTYDASLKNATVLPPNNAVGRKGLDRSIFLGYTAEPTPESPSWGLEGFINDFGIGNMAARLAEDPATPADRVEQLREESKYFLDRASHYTYLFDEEAGFFKPREADGSWETPADEYDPTEWGNGYTETDGWNFAFHVPFDGPGLASLYGGHAGLQDKLSEFYATPETGTNVGSYGGVIHEMTEARDTRIGQLGMSNQVSHHIPYMSALAGDATTTQETVREITRRLFVGSDIGQGYPGDEDNGETSSWFIFSSLGFYPLQMGSGDYTIGSPLFTKATVHLEGGEDLVVEAPDNSRENIYVQSASFDGEELESTSIGHETIAGGGTLRFDMGSTPSEWGNTAPDDVETPKPMIDLTKPGSGTSTASDATALGSIVDDNSRSEVTFADAEPTVTVTSNQGPVTVPSYTITDGAEGTAPSAWTLEGSADGENWVVIDERDDQEFPWGNQTRPFQIEDPKPFAQYRLAMSTADGTAPTLSEIELLVDTEAVSTDFELFGQEPITAEAGVELDAPLAALTGASDTASDYEVTVDFQDGTEAQDATLTRSAFGSWQVSASHVFEQPGRYDVQITATFDGGMASAVTAVDVVRTAPPLGGAFDNVCIGDIGQGGNCDFLNNAYSRTSLAESGFVQGTTIPVPGTELTFDLPAVAPGQPDNATGQGQVIPLDLGDGATQFSVIGTATERAQETVGVLTFDDGSTQELPISYGDWSGSVDDPEFGNILVGRSDFRITNGERGPNTPGGIFSTAPVTLPEGKTAVSLTMPTQTGDPRASGRIHVFAFASDGTRVAPEQLTVTGGALSEVTVGEAFTAELATITGAVEGGEYAATVNWGDGSATDEGIVTLGADGEVAALAVASVTGSHTYEEAGDYEVTVVVDDGTASASGTSTISVVRAEFAPAIAVGADPVRPGAVVPVTGVGFAPSESVTLTLSSDPAVVVELQSGVEGELSGSVTVPEDAADGTYPITAIGAVSDVEASAEVLVEAGAEVPVYDPELRVLAGSATRGEIVPIDGSGFAPGETVTLTLDPQGQVLGTFVANADGVITGRFTVPDDATIGDHEVRAVGSASQVAVLAAFAVTDVPPADGGTAPADEGEYEGILADTGGDAQAFAWPAVGAAALLLAGVGALAAAWFVRRRRDGAAG